MGGEAQGGVLLMIGRFIGMVILHVLLLIVHRSGTSRPRNEQLSPMELFVGIVIFWASQRCAGRILVTIGAVLSLGLSEFTAHHREHQGSHKYIGFRIGDLRFSSIWDTAASLFEIALITWFLHLSLIFVLDTGIPFYFELRESPQKASQKVNIRLKEILSFLQSTFQQPFPGLLVDPSQKFRNDIFNANEQTIHLERRQMDYPSQGQRRLSWNIVVDKDAMDEMKETLGPPGGFGELGFNVARDGVRFEAMGVGTSFNLMFKLREDKEERSGRRKKGSKNR
jgi:hypothetical protein